MEKGSRRIWHLQMEELSLNWLFNLVRRIRHVYGIGKRARAAGWTRHAVYTRRPFFFTVPSDVPNEIVENREKFITHHDMPW